MGNTNLNEFFNREKIKVEKIDRFDYWKIPHDGHTPKMAQKFVFPESGSGKHFHASAMRTIDSSTRKTLERAKFRQKSTYIARYQHFKMKFQH
jgi:hypothetical protein